MSIPASNGQNWKQMFSAFQYRNYRLYFTGLLISTIGLWAQTIAQDWLVLDLTNSPRILGEITAVRAIPVLLIGPWAGVIIDRTSRRTLLLITQSTLMIQAFIMAALTFSGRIEIWHIFWLSGLRGLANAFDAPTRHTFVVEMVDKKDRSNAIALNSTLFSLARTLGPSVGAMVLAVMGMAWSFTVNGLTFLAIIFALLIIQVKNPVLQPSERSPFIDLKEGLSYIWNQKTILALMAIVLTIALFGANFNVLMPVVAREILYKDEIGYGIMGTALGVGSIIGTLLVTYFSSQPNRGRRLLQMNVLFPLSLIAFAFSRSFGLSLVLLFFIGLSFIPQLSLSNMLIQSYIPDHIRGRVMSVYSLVVFGAFPIGAWIAGNIAEQMGAPLAIILSAGAVIIITQLVRIATPQLADLN